MNKKSFRILKLSLEEAREYYYSDNYTKRELALMLFSEEELIDVNFNDILYSINDETYVYCDEYAVRLKHILIVAKYFNKSWEKTYNNEGYYWDYNPEYGWSIKKHISVKYPGVIYYKNETIAKQAFKLCKREYNAIK